ncbi:hypothetical protein [Pseudorhodoferax soli]|uniref:Uncharacterized protein n=1 Tax=Pseudorhodoferax soli TaxID=545864 RepID=A0A368XEV5_9BURK|nr:hypothetical protein [Pseudorhodoferax soli]RCW66179.1 hypothetical protein DES41_111137 [Pseudorhodoferax soli]
MEEMSVFLRVVLGLIVMSVPAGLVFQAMLALRRADKEMDEISKQIWGEVRS